MPRAGRRYPLLIYTHMLNRWWPATLTLSLAIFTLAWGVSRTLYGKEDPVAVFATIGLGLFVLVVTLALFTIRKSAYVQPFRDHLRLVTPFLRLKISYRRFHSTTTTEMRILFPPTSLSGWRRQIIAPLSGMTAIVINLIGFPLSPALLRLFLSPFFFKDRTPHFVILVKEWMRFSSELESFRTGGETDDVKVRTQDSSLLSRLPHK